MPRAIVFTLVIVSGTVLGEGKKPFKQEEEVLSVLKSYIGCVDEKNVEGMLEHIIIPLTFTLVHNKLPRSNQKVSLRKFLIDGTILKNQIFTLPKSNLLILNKQEW